MPVTCNNGFIDYSGCFKYYLNMLGFGMKQTWPKPDDQNYDGKMKILSYSIASFSFTMVIFIIKMQILAYKKQKQIK